MAKFSSDLATLNLRINFASVILDLKFKFEKSVPMESKTLFVK